MSESEIETDVALIGAGAAGCVAAARLSEQTGLRVVLLEAGRDLEPGTESASIRDIYTFSAAFDPGNQWPGLNVRTVSEGMPGHYEQARLIGGGTSINGLQAAIGTPADYDDWAERGATGWSYLEVAPYFDRLAGDSGRFPIHRVAKADWPPFTAQATAAMAAHGLAEIADPNADFGDGWFAMPFMSDGASRMSAAMVYLDRAVRARPNLRILPDTEATRIVFDGREVRGVEARSGGRAVRIACRRVVVCAGALGSPLLLLRSGIGPADHVAGTASTVVAELRGVGANLQEHPSVALSALLTPGMARGMTPRRHILAGLRFSSRAADAPANDLYMVVVNRAAWHAIGWRIASLFTWVNKPVSKGHVRLAADGRPDIALNLLADAHDVVRLGIGLRLALDLMRAMKRNGTVTDIVLPEANAAFRAFLTQSPGRAALMHAAAASVDRIPPARRAFLAQFRDAEAALPDPACFDETAAFLRDRVVPGWHPVGTCRMGPADAPDSVTDPRDGAVHGVAGLHVADASVIPVIPRANTALPTMMVAEKLAEGIRTSIATSQDMT